ncbi:MULTISPECIES: ABC transporter ATP-binding protein [Paenibacillus]|uniref:ABC transporter ATP-binding protein n=1 Tax=Paenibacillus TaxID=44249 RepID=UPI00096D0648|nr:ATP-binding cassette domain-containing protein [Paenibacillus odorifer]OMD17281.1 sugar ABC transporter ATP-binding protein [Paenibacillus odorifer]
MIRVEDVRRSFKIAKRSKGLAGAFKNVFYPNYEIKKAVNGISFTIEDGETVGFIGPNGAGKSTTVKMLSGILHPDSGEINIDGYIPYIDRKKFVSQIGVVFGQKSQLWRDLSIMDTFDLLKHIYKIPDNEYKRNMDMFNDIMELYKFEKQSVRQLSLGQRMRADIVAAFLHNPSVVFLDEPTIGLDVVVKEKIREFIATINKERNTTLLFTTHDMQDIEKTCRRIIVIDEGKLIYDGSLHDMRQKYGKERKLVIEFSDKYDEDIAYNGVRIINDTENPNKQSFVFTKEINVSELISDISSKHSIMDLTIEEPEIEGIIREIYGRG